MFFFQNSCLLKCGGQFFFFVFKEVILSSVGGNVLSFFEPRSDHLKDEETIFFFSNKQFLFEMWGAMFFLFTAVIFSKVGGNAFFFRTKQ